MASRLAIRSAWGFALRYLFLAVVVVAGHDLNDPGDLTSFVTRPEIKAPKVVVKHRDDRRVSPGYWFVGPYSWYGAPRLDSHFWLPCQAGPQIFDNDGELIWSGACQFNNSLAFDFRAVTVNGEQHLSFLAHLDIQSPEFTGFILDNHYEIQTSVPGNSGPRFSDLHEFNILNDGASALLGTFHLVPGVEEDPGFVNRTMGHTFREIDLQSGRTLFQWDSFDHIDPNVESATTWRLLVPGEPNWSPIPTKFVWDYFHLNSIDKDSEGDYLISARHTDCIYKISGKDGSIIWRLGGKLTDFAADFNFSRQHSARYIESNKTHTTISFLNNAADENTNTSAYSSGMVVLLSTAESPMKATLLARFDRPDRRLTRKTGNVQVLPHGGNIVVDWADAGYVSEFTPDGDCVMEASFMSDRWNTYRAFKSNFSAYPTEPPVLKGFAYGTKESHAITVFYVSWNGATEVSAWNFYGGDNTLIGNTAKTGFETMFTVDRYMEKAWVEGLDGNGNVLGSSSVEETVIPPNWKVGGAVHYPGLGESVTEEENKVTSILRAFFPGLARMGGVVPAAAFITICCLLRMAYCLGRRDANPLHRRVNDSLEDPSTAKTARHGGL